MLFPFIDGVIDKIYLNKEHSYTISERVTFGVASKVGAYKSKYLFKVKDKEYAGFTALPLKYDGTRYFVKFYPGNPNRSQATDIIADSLDINNLPHEGYRILPHDKMRP